MSQFGVGIGAMGFLLLMFLGLSIASILLFKRHRVLAIVLAIPVVLVGFAVVALMTIRGNRPPTRTEASRHTVDQIAQSATLTTPTTPWSKGVDEFLPADIYPSAVAAADAAARQLIAQLPPRPPPPQVSPDLTVYCADMTAARRVVHAFTQSDKVGQVTLNSDEAATATPRWEAHVQIQTNDVSIQFQGEGPSGLAIVPYVDKPWVDRFSEYVNRHPNNDHLRAVSDQPFTSEAEARDRAVELAAGYLTEPVVEQIRQGYPQLFSGQYAPIRRDWVQSRIAAHLPEVITDRFVQRFERPFGDIWQVWILVDRSLMTDTVTHRIGMEAHSRRSAAVAETGAVRRSWLARIFSVAGIVVVILLAYLFLNIATRGYYVWMLRIAAIVLGLLVFALWRASPF